MRPRDGESFLGCIQPPFSSSLQACVSGPPSLLSPSLLLAPVQRRSSCFNSGSDGQLQLGREQRALLAPLCAVPLCAALGQSLMETLPLFRLFVAGPMPGMPSDLLSDQGRLCGNALIPFRKVPVAQFKYPV